MDFSLSEEEQLLKDSVERFVREEYTLEQRRKLVASDEGFSRENWSKMAELGWLGASFPEAYGGYGGGPVATMIIMEAFGQGLVVEPFLPSIVLGGGLIATGGDEAQKQEILPALAEGRMMLAFGYAERQSRYDLFDVEMKAAKDGDGYVLNGHKGVVFHAAVADKIIVTARTSGGSRDKDGITLFIVDKGAAGLSRRDYPTVDGYRASELTLENVRAEAVLGAVDGGYGIVETVAQQGVAALAAEAVGCMGVLLDTTNEYVKTRKQFGQPIGKFQVIQHRMADMFIACEEARSMSYLATLRLEDEDAGERARASASTKVQIGKSATYVSQQAVQLHGGMGMTDELNVGHYFKRLTMIDTMLGDQDYHLKRYAEL
ncbi:MAG: acyl-CoA dehydrogenase family protein [Alphaproteobacteria bacterium]|jgi:pimeloyl-CoA dehydrogenase small subunit